jgi:hypothetical protein
MPVYNPASNFPNLSQLSNDILAHVPRFVLGAVSVRNEIQNFLTSQTEASYNNMRNALESAKIAHAIDENAKLRILLSIDDGTVAYDSSRTTNTYSNFVSNTINSANHNTRPEILSALLGQSGVALSERFSRSVSTFQKYHALRYGATTESNLGTFRVSMDTTIPE